MKKNNELQIRFKAFFTIAFFFVFLYLFYSTLRKGNYFGVLLLPLVIVSGFVSFFEYTFFAYQKSQFQVLFNIKTKREQELEDSRALNESINPVPVTPKLVTVNR